jgi:hypothetical protein
MESVFTKTSAPKTSGRGRLPDLMNSSTLVVTYEAIDFISPFDFSIGLADRDLEDKLI